MGDFKFKLAGLLLIFVTASLLFKMDFKTQMDYAFNYFDVDVDEMTTEAMNKILGHSVEEIMPSNFYTYLQPETIENTISKEKYQKLTNILDLEKDHSAVLIRGYENGEYVTARYYIELKGDDTLVNIQGEYEEKLLNSGYKEKDDCYVKDNIEIKFLQKWDCITIIVKGL